MNLTARTVAGAKIIGKARKQYDGQGLYLHIPEGLDGHAMLAHASAEQYPDVPTDHDALRDWLDGRNIEGLVWHHPDGRMAKIKLRDYKLTRRA